MKKIFIAIMAIAFFISCKNESKKENLAIVTTDLVNNEKPKPEEDVNKSGIVGNISDKKAAPQEDPDKGKKNQQDSSDKQDWDKKIIKTANLNLEVKDNNIIQHFTS